MVHTSVTLIAALIFMIFALFCGYPMWYGCFWAVITGAITWLIQRKQKETLARLLWALGPLLSFLTVEYMIGNISYFPFVCELKNIGEILLNLIGYYMIAGVLFLICGRRKLSAILSTVLFLIIGLSDSYFFAFRGRVIFPSDFIAARTAMNVLSNYDFTPSLEQVLGTLTAIGYIVATVFMPRVKGRHMPKWNKTVIVSGVCVAYLFLFFGTPFLTWVGFEAKLWTSLWKTRQNGVLLNFAVNLHFSSVEKPDGYDERLDPLIKQYDSDPTQTEKRPNVIAIMNESFCDLSVLGVETNAECLPFIYSMSENTIKGSAYVSVFGGHTANSEYEFLTGNSISYLPVGTVAYQMFTRDGDHSLSGQMKDLGYDTIAMHPYFSSGWNRVQVYERYRFDETYFQDDGKEDFKNVRKIRNYISDASDYENLISVFESHRESSDAPLFLFNVTMQNHGDYSVNWKGLEKTVWMTGRMQNSYESADMYLSLARESDRAFSELVAYFSTVDEPTIIVMFGDHQPGLANSFYRKLFGMDKDELPVDQAVSLYQVPYVIWANYDIEEQTYGNFSLNYLSTVLMETADLPMTGYQKFLSQALREIPVITRNFYRDANGEFTNVPTDLSKQAQQFLNDYQILQYNGVKGGSKRVSSFFGLISP